MSLITDLRSTSRLGVMVAVTAAAVGVIYGYDSSNIAGALLFLTEDLHLSTHDQQVAATAVVIGEIFGALIGGPLSNKIGRKRSMVLVAATFGLFSLLSALAVDLNTLAAARFLLGLTVGVSVVVVPVFVAESSPTKIRGSMLVLYQLACVTGIIGGYLIAWALSSTGSWRLMLGLAAVPAALVLIALLKLPDTARWYMMRGDRARAREVLNMVDPDVDIDHELDEIAEALQAEGGGSVRARLREMVTAPYRRATFFVVGLGFFIQITGINAVVYYGPRIFEAMGMSGYFAKLGLPRLSGSGAARRFHIHVEHRPDGPSAHPHDRNRHHDRGRRAAGGCLRRGRILVRWSSDIPRVPGHRAHRGGLHLWLRVSGVGVRR